MKSRKLYILSLCAIIIHQPYLYIFPLLIGVYEQRQNMKGISHDAYMKFVLLSPVEDAFIRFT